MSEVEYIYDVDKASFDARVIQKSHQVPVLVDFWAAWCAPCKTLMPRLHKLAEGYQGELILAKINTDAEQEIAARYQIRSLPTVVLFKDGRIVDHFVGVQPDSVIMRMLEPYIRRQSDTALEQAVTLLEAGNLDKALSTLTTAVEKYPDDDRLKLKLVELYLEHKESENAGHILAEVGDDTKHGAEYKRLSALLEFLRNGDSSRSLDELIAQIQRDPDNLAARYSLASRYAAEGSFEPAMIEFLEIVRRDRSFMDDAGRKGLLRVFAVAGDKTALVNRYRGLLARALN